MSDEAPAPTEADPAAATTLPPPTTLALLPSDKPKDDAADDAALGTLFSTRKPRNASAGAASGLKSVAKGVGMGVVGLVAAPAIGAKENGVKGFVQGLGAGIVGAVALPLTGAVVGAVQLTRGVLNTPEAVQERGRGKIWDEDSRAWVIYDLNEQARELLAMSEEEWCKQHGVKMGGDGGSGGQGTDGKVKETELYEVLGVESSASQAAIRKSYFKLAKELHPDKNIDDPNAHAKFQAVGEAYQVLSNDELRAKYDKQGKAALEASSLADPTAFFAMLFGSEPFEYLIGELRLATMFANGGEVDEAYMAYKQKRREVLCALTLKGLLQQFCCGDELEFEQEMHTHAQALVKAPMGDALIWTCGYIYEHKGIQALGGFEGISSKMQQTMHTTASQMRVAGAAIKTYRAFRKDVAKPKLEAKEKEKEKEKEAKDKDKEAKANDKGKAGKAGKAADAVFESATSSAASSSSSAGGVGSSATDGGGGQGAAEAGGSSAPSLAGKLVGKRVLIEGLQGRQDLNGRHGLAGSYDVDAGRYAVRLDDDECVKVRAANLKCVDAPGTDADGAAPGATADSSEGAAGEGAMPGGPSEDTMFLMLESMWRVSMLDIESTLRHACNKVLADTSADKDAKRNRARGLVVMGRVFQSYGSPDALKAMDFKQHVEQVGQKMAANMQEEMAKQREAD